jgi:dihydrofolate reductase
VGRLILYIATSLDGHIADEDGGVGWLERFEAGEEDYGYGALLERVGTAIMGGRTYRQVLGFGPWPYASLTTYVVTRQPLLDPPAPSIRSFHGDVGRLLNRLREESDQDTWLVGGADLVSQFVNRQLIDEYILFVMPLFLGRGIPLFRDLQTGTLLELDRILSYASGVVELRYRAAAGGAP